MELIINLTHDVLYYEEGALRGSLKNENLFGFQKFGITEMKTHFEIDFYGDDGSIYTYECKFTDHGKRLVVVI